MQGRSTDSQGAPAILHLNVGYGRRQGDILGGQSLQISGADHRRCALGDSLRDITMAIGSAARPRHKERL